MCEIVIELVGMLGVCIIDICKDMIFYTLYQVKDRSL